jgi:CheY-like chemotaxis protein
LQQVFSNILENAVKFTPEGGRITVTTRILVDKPSRFSVRIIDTGIGMTSGELNRVFDAFSQGNHSETESYRHDRGLGLGLSISRKIAELHSGEIRAESAGLGHGSTFTVEITLLDLQAQTEGAAQDDSTPQFPGSTKVPSRRRILLVEDHEDTRTALSRLLSFKYEVVNAGSGTEARSRANEGIDLVISDIGLPDETGYELMAALQNEHGLKGIALTGYGMEEDVVRSHKAAFLAHLTKPVRFDQLEEILDDVFARRPNSENRNL